MSHAENPSDNKLGTLVKLQVFRSFIPIYMSLLTGVTKSGWNGQLNSQNVAFALGVAFLEPDWLIWLVWGCKRLGKTGNSVE